MVRKRGDQRAEPLNLIGVKNDNLVRKGGVQPEFFGELINGLSLTL